MDITNCELCQKLFMTKIDKNNHLLKIHNIKINYSNMIQMQLMEIKKEKLVKREIKNNKKLKIDEKKVKIKKTYICNKCNKLFNHKVVYERHIKRKYPCDNLKNNIIINCKNNKYYCSKCNKPFSNQYNLQRHFIYFCEEKSNNIIQLNSEKNNQRKIIMNNDEAPLKKKIKKEYKCVYCHKQFSRSDSLNRHYKARCKIKMKILI